MVVFGLCWFVSVLRFVVRVVALALGFVWFVLCLVCVGVYVVFVVCYFFVLC